MLIQPGGLLALRELAPSMPSPKPACPSTAWRQPPFLAAGRHPLCARPAGARRDAARDDAGVAQRGELGVRLHLDAPIAALEPSRDRVLLRWGEHEQVYEGAVIASGSGSDLAQQCGLSAPTSPYAWGALNGMISVADWQWPTILHQRMHGPRKLFGLMPCSYTGAQLDIAMFWSLPSPAMRNGRHRTWKRGRPSWSAFGRKAVRGGPDPRSLAVQLRHLSSRLAQAAGAGPSAWWAMPPAMSPQLGLGSTLAMGDAWPWRAAAPHG